MEETRSWGPPWRADRRTGRYARGEYRRRRAGTGPGLNGEYRRRRSGAGPGLTAVALFLQLSNAHLTHVRYDHWQWALLFAGPIALLWRRRAPEVVFAVAAAAGIGFAAYAEPRWAWAVAPGFALYSVARAGRRTQAIVCAVLGFAAYLLVCWVFAARLGLPPASRPGLREAILLPIGLALTIFVGGAARVRSQHIAELAKMRAERQRAEDEQAKRQASEERLRIARELHDALGHHLSLISVQAGVGLHLLDNRPEQAREALAAIKTASAEALREMRAVLGVLRPEDEAAPRQPALGLSRLGDLTADAGLPVTTTVTGAARELPAEVDRAAYRIVQEALTNVRKHAGTGATAAVTVGYEPERLVLTIRNQGTAGATSETGGNGIAGMRARAASLGGTLTAGPEDDGFAVTATLPLRPAGEGSAGEGSAGEGPAGEGEDEA